MNNNNPIACEFQQLVNELAWVDGYAGLAVTSGSEGQLRQSNRHPRSVSLLVQPLNEDFHNCGDPIFAVTRDITAEGLGFVNPAAVQRSYLRVTLLDYEASTIAAVRHNTPVGNGLPLFLVGLQFLTDRN